MNWETNQSEWKVRKDREELKEGIKFVLANGAVAFALYVLFVGLLLA